METCGFVKPNGDVCGEEAVNECFHCGPLCRNHEKEPCSAQSGHFGLDLTLSEADVAEVTIRAVE